jgi:DNA-binding NtrC family response regulator
MTATDINTNTVQKILVIDDEEVVRILFQSLLEDEGYQVVLAETAEEGIKLLAEHTPSVALVDKNLPDMSGVELISTQKKTHPNTEFVMITGYASLDSAVKAMEVGAFSYLTKPFDDMDIVLDRIRAAVEVNNLRIETSQLREKINKIPSSPQETQIDDKSRQVISDQLANKLKQTITFLESFISKREQPPTPASWARTVDMIEQEVETLKEILATELF